MIETSASANQGPSSVSIQALRALGVSADCDLPTLRRAYRVRSLDERIARARLVPVKVLHARGWWRANGGQRGLEGRMGCKMIRLNNRQVRRLGAGAVRVLRYLCSALGANQAADPSDKRRVQASLADIAAALKMAPKTVGKHLQRLRACGAIHTTRQMLQADEWPDEQAPGLDFSERIRRSMGVGVARTAGPIWLGIGRHDVIGFVHCHPGNPSGDVWVPAQAWREYEAALPKWGGARARTKAQKPDEVSSTCEADRTGQTVAHPGTQIEPVSTSDRALTDQDSGLFPDQDPDLFCSPTGSKSCAPGAAGLIFKNPEEGSGMGNDAPPSGPGAASPVRPEAALGAGAHARSSGSGADAGEDADEFSVPAIGAGESVPEPGQLLPAREPSAAGTFSGARYPLDPAETDEHNAEVLAAALRAVGAERFGAHWRHLFRGGVAESKHLGFLVRAAKAMIEHGVYPDEWIAWVHSRRFFANQPRVSWKAVVGPGFLARRAGWHRAEVRAAAIQHPVLSEEQEEQRYRLAEHRLLAQGLRQVCQVFHGLPAWYLRMRMREWGEGALDPMVRWPEAKRPGLPPRLVRERVRQNALPSREPAGGAGGGPRSKLN